jgi:simple sugar transport system permease protein
VRFKVDDVVSSLLLNSIAYYALMALIKFWKDPLSGYPISPPIQETAMFPVLMEGTRLHLGVLVAILAAPVIWFVISRTTLGFAIRVTGENPEAARYGGINVRRVILSAAILSGALAGLAGVNEVGGVHFQVMSDISPGYGYSGIVIAMLARLNPLGVVPAAIFLAAVMTGAEAMSRATGVPVFLSDVIQGTALLAMLVALLFTAYRIRRRGTAS